MKLMVALQLYKLREQVFLELTSRIETNVREEVLDIGFSEASVAVGIQTLVKAQPGLVV